VWDYVNQFAEFNHYVNSPVANYKGEMYNLPFNMNTFSKMWNIRTPKEAQDIITKQRAAISGEPKNLEEQAISLVGTDIMKSSSKGIRKNNGAVNVQSYQLLLLNVYLCVIHTIIITLMTASKEFLWEVIRR